MKIRLIDDPKSKMPNLALMKLSAWHKQRGDLVGFNVWNPDLIYVSCIFPQSLGLISSQLTFFSGVPTIIGGYGFGAMKLEDSQEHIKPDYDLYGLNYSMGFTTRGCINNCPFCIIPKIEGDLRENSPLEEFLDDRFNKVILFDNNFLASHKSIEKLRKLKDLGLKVNFNQGIDLRLVNYENARLLSEIPCYDRKFKTKSLYGAWDLMKDEEKIKRGIRILREYGINKIMVYFLVRFNTTHKEDKYRFDRLIDLDVRPYVQVYNNLKDDKWVRHFARWVNQRFYEVVPFKEYKHGILSE